MALKEIAAAKAVTLKKPVAGEARTLEQELNRAGIESGYDKDVLSQFKANLQQVEDLNSRLRFVLNEVNGLLKRV